jgi:aspartyl/asparaginyl beta-hydroxylase (cupin superfamily)
LKEGSPAVGQCFTQVRRFCQSEVLEAGEDLPYMNRSFNGEDSAKLIAYYPGVKARRHTIKKGIIFQTGKMEQTGTDADN